MLSHIDIHIRLGYEMHSVVILYYMYFICKGWFPIYDTMKGIRGSLYVLVKLQFIGNNNPFRESSAGVQFFTASTLSPHAFIIQEV